VAEDRVIRLPVSTFADGKARHYTYMAGDRPVEFFVLRSADGTVRAAFNACDVCFQARRGYVQDGDTMVCVNCGRRFPADQINVVLTISALVALILLRVELLKLSFPIA